MNESRDVWMVGDVLDAMSGSAVPDFIERVIQEVQSWLSSAVVEACQIGHSDLMIGMEEHQVSGDLDYIFGQLEWVGVYADFLPAVKETGSHEDAVVLSVGPILLGEGIRMAVDHAALFARESCRRIWLISDTWVMGDVLAYMPHLKALYDRGIHIRFLLVTPWGFSEIPWNRDSKDIV